MAKVRLPSQAGSFYEGTAESLRKQIANCFLHELGPGRLPAIANSHLKRVIGLVCPHAGYMFSGSIAAHAYYELASDGRPDTVAIFGPNHTGHGSALAIANEGVWRTPLGDVEIDTEITSKIVRESRIIDIDASAHRWEHSIEVQLPFLQYLYGSKFKIAPICFMLQDLHSSREVGEAVGKVLTGQNAVMIASSDMSHYESQERAVKHDELAIKSIEAMDDSKFHTTIETHRISACGYGPITALIVASKIMGGKEAKLLCYKTSGDVIGDYSSVVGYAAMCVTK